MQPEEKHYRPSPVISKLSVPLTSELILLPALLDLIENQGRRRKSTNQKMYFIVYHFFHSLSPYIQLKVFTLNICSISYYLSFYFLECVQRIGRSVRFLSQCHNVINHNIIQALHPSFLKNTLQKEHFTEMYRIIRVQINDFSQNEHICVIITLIKKQNIFRITNNVL